MSGIVLRQLSKQRERVLQLVSEPDQSVPRRGIGDAGARVLDVLLLVILVPAVAHG